MAKNPIMLELETITKSTPMSMLFTFINPGKDDQNSIFGITSLPVAPLLYFINNIPGTR